LIGSCSGYFYAIDKDTGQLRWKYTIEQDGDQTSFRDDPLVAGDLIIIGTDAGRQGHIYAFDRSTGKVRWKYLVHTGTLQDFGVRSDMVRKGDAIYAVATGDDLLCLDLAAGEVRWHFASGFDRQRTEWENSPAVDGDKILFAGHDRVVYALDSDSCRPVWKAELRAPALTSPAVVGGSVYIGTSDRFYHLRSSDGKVVGSVPLPSSRGETSRCPKIAFSLFQAISSTRTYPARFCLSTSHRPMSRSLPGRLARTATGERSGPTSGMATSSPATRGTCMLTAKLMGRSPGRTTSPARWFAASGLRATCSTSEPCTA
jgi:outer membrane protein assembly factor BamB